jgi:hypothetical protein
VLQKSGRPERIVEKGNALFSPRRSNKEPISLHELKSKAKAKVKAFDYKTKPSSSETDKIQDTTAREKTASPPDSEPSRKAPVSSQELEPKFVDKKACSMHDDGSISATMPGISFAN